MTCKINLPINLYVFNVCLKYWCGYILGHSISFRGSPASSCPGRAVSTGRCASQAWAALPREHGRKEEMWERRFHLQVGCLEVWLTERVFVMFCFFPSPVELCPLAQLGKYLIYFEILVKHSILWYGKCNLSLGRGWGGMRKDCFVCSHS